MTALKIAIGCDHAGFEYKEQIKKELTASGYSVQDFGTFSAASVDYPDFVHPLAMAVEKEESNFGILLCGSANGVAMTANKHQKIRAGLCWNEEVACLTRQHNNANIVCIPARFVSVEEAIKIANVFLSTPFEGGRHQLRVDKISGSC
jgi:ribose 5-phosphate isomerase B